MNARKDSSIINIRMFHNWVKNQLIRKVCSLVHKRNPTLLDLAVGKGGDMNKWVSNHINYVVGFDINKDSLFGESGATERYTSLVRRMKFNKPNYKFYEMDLSKPDNIDKISNILGNKKFDLVSCQFAIHYFFLDSTSLDNFIKIVATYQSCQL